jgi:polyisoprenoid-binding protein YceI
MKNILHFALFFALLLSVGTVASAQTADVPPDVPTWRVDAAHSSVGFKVRHLGIASVSGVFNTYEATFALDPSDVSTLSASTVVQVASINTNNERRDNHLRSDDFFNAEAHPELTFTTTSVKPLDGGRFELSGDLTIRGTTKPITLQGEVIGTAVMGGTERVAIEAEGVVNRFDYGLKWDSLTEAGGLVVGEDVRLVLAIQAVRQ